MNIILYKCRNDISILEVQIHKKNVLFRFLATRRLVGNFLCLRIVDRQLQVFHYD